MASWFKASTYHKRFEPVQHSFQYSMMLWNFKSEQTSELNRFWPFLGHNRPALMYVNEWSCLTLEKKSIREKAEEILRRDGNYYGPMGLVECILIPNFLGLKFNPVRFYLCHDEEKTQRALLIEINNTFGQRSIYSHLITGDNDQIKFRIERDFYISPFSEVSGEFDFIYKRQGDKSYIEFFWIKDNKVWLSANLRLKEYPLTWTQIPKMLASGMILPALTSSRILYQAAKLYFSKKLKQAEFKNKGNRPFVAQKELFLQRVLTKNPVMQALQKRNQGVTNG